MQNHAERKQEKRSPAVATQTSKKRGENTATSQFVDNRPEAGQLRKMQEMADNSPQAQHLRAMQAVADNSPQARQAAQVQAMVDNSPLMVAQRQQIDRMFGKPVQRDAGAKEDELLLKSESGPSQRQSTYEEGPVQKKENDTGLPDNLKAGVENLSGVSLDDVKVHRNSSKPAGLQALAYTQGTDIHVGPGQEQHLPHEAWHVAQQKQGRVKPTMQMAGTQVNDDQGLEHEADVMGAKAVNGLPRAANSNQSPFQFVDNRPEAIAQRKLLDMANNNGSTVQRMLSVGSGNGGKEGGNGDRDRKKPQDIINMDGASAILRRVRERWEVVRQYINQHTNTIINVLGSNVDDYNNNYRLGAALFWLLNGLRNQLVQLWDAYDNEYDGGADRMYDFDAEDTAGEVLNEEHQANLLRYTDAYDILTGLIVFFEDYANEFHRLGGNPQARNMFDAPPELQIGGMTVQESMRAGDRIAAYNIRQFLNRE